MRTEIQTDPKKGTIYEKKDLSYYIACRALKESGLLTALSDTDVERILKSLKYELISFKKNERLISRKEEMDYFLILYEGSLKIPLGTGEMKIRQGTFWKDQIVGLDVCFTEQKISYFNIYAASDGIAIKYFFQKLLDTTRISTVSRIRLLSNMTRYIADMNIVRFKTIDFLKILSLDHRILLYLLQKEESYNGSPVDLRQCSGFLNHLGVSSSVFSARLQQLEENGLLKVEEKMVWIHHPQAEKYLKDVRWQ